MSSSTKFPLVALIKYDSTIQYIQLQDYALWEIIESGNYFKPVARVTTNADGSSTSQYLVLMPRLCLNAIEARFGGKCANRRHNMTLMKRTYENFNASVQSHWTLSLNSLQKLVSKLSYTCDAIVYAFLANQPSGSQFVHEDLEQIHDDDLKEIDLKWQLALLSMRARKFCQRTRKKITINGSDTVEKKPYKSREKARSYDQGSRSQDNLRRTVKIEDTSSKAMVAIDGAGFDWSYMIEEEVPTNMAHMAFFDS
ncbi:hypothetical protein Tco_0620457 [Tanacetum coccineum]